MKRNIVPIAFCFDDNLVLPAGICINSLLLHAKEDTFYDIYILHDQDAMFPTTSFFDRLSERFQNFSITFRSVGDQFRGNYEIREITYAAYYRLLIPEVVPEYDKIFYFDVDVIFQSDLSELYSTINIADYYIAGTSTPISDIADYIVNEIGMEVKDYICSGTLLLNSKKIKEDNIIPEFKNVASKNWKYQDQDTLNIVCRDKILVLPPWFGVVGTISKIIADSNQKYYTEAEVRNVRQMGIIHYNGPKPWKEMCLNFDIWWEYYRKSVYFEYAYYFNFFESKLNPYDQLSLWKRIKILLRYFKTKFQ